MCQSEHCHWSDSLHHAIEEAVGELAGGDWVRDARINTREQPQHPRTCRGGRGRREREREGGGGRLAFV